MDYQRCKSESNQYLLVTTLINLAMTQTNRKTIFGILLATIAAASVIAFSGTELSYAVLDRTLGHLDGVDDTVKDVGDDVSDLEHDVGDSVDNAGENVGDILRGDD
jgi:hypothetical protein